MANLPQEPAPYLADRSWIDVQKKTFTNWVNDHLKDTGLSVEDLQIDLDTGVVLIKLLEALAPGKKMPGKYHTKPRLLFHKSQNLTIAFDFLTGTEQIPLVNIGPTDIMEHNLKLILGLIWILILHYQIASAPQPATEIKEDTSAQKPQSSDSKKTTARKTVKKGGGKKLLLRWLAATLPNHKIVNVTTNWNDGTKLSALVDHCKPGLIPNHASLDPNRPLENITNAMTLAEEHLSVPQVMQPEDLAVDEPDELSVMTYLSYFCRPGSVGEQVLLEWIQKRIPHKNITNFSTDWVDGRALGALTDVVSGGEFPEEEQMVSEGALQNCLDSMEAAERLLGVKKIITSNEFANPDLDQLTRMSYLTQFRHAKSSSATPKLKATGQGIHGGFIGHETSFLVSGRVPKWGKLNTSVMTPSGEKLRLKEERMNDRSVSYKYTPVTTDTHTVVIMLDQEHIPGSPFSVTHSTPSNAKLCTASGDGLQMARVADSSEFSVNCESGGSGELQVEVRGPTGSIGTEITEPRDRNFKVQYAPVEPGPHTIAVKWDGQHVPDSPFTCLVTDPKKCTATGAGLTKAKVGEAGHFTVKTDKAGPGTLTAEVEGPSGDKIPVQIRDEGKGKFTCTWIPKEEGPHSVEVKWSGAQITGSPFKINAIAPVDSSKCKVSGLPLKKLRSGKVSTFVVDTSEAGSGELKAFAQGPSVPEKCEVVSKGEGIYEVRFTPLEVGKLQVQASYAQNPIEGSPFDFTVNDPSKCKVNAAAIASGSYTVKQPFDFRVGAKFAGDGDLTATSRGPKGEEQLKITPQGDGNYLVHYIPKDTGQHAIDIRFDSEPIPNVPIRLFVQSGFTAGSVVVTQPVPDRFGAFTIDHDYTYRVSAAGAGDAALTATSYGARSGQTPKVNVTSIGNGAFDVAVNAKEPDMYNVNILWGDEHVPGSPFKLEVKDKPRPEKVVCSGPHYEVGQTDPVTLDVNTVKAGAGKLEVTCHGGKVGSVPVEIGEREPDNYKVSFVPPAIDVYSLNVLWARTAVKDSPFKANLFPPDASKCVVTGPTLPSETNKPVEVTVDAIEAGNGRLAATAVGDKAGPSGVSVKEIQPNVFKVSFVPSMGDRYNLDVTWGGRSVPGAPWRLNLIPPTAEGVVLVESPSDTLETGQVARYCFDTSAAGNGQLTATCAGTRCGNVPVTVAEKSPEMYDVKFTAVEPDIYNINVMWSGKHVKGSPFQINLRPIDVSKVTVEGPTQPKGLQGPVEVTLRTAGAGRGRVKASCHDSQDEKIPTTVKEIATDCYVVAFKPPTPNVYALSIQYGDHGVKGSPFHINTLPPDASKVKVTEPTAVKISEPAVFKVDACSAGSGELTAYCRGDNYGAVQPEISQEAIGEFQVSFTPHHKDHYNLKLQWAGVEVPDSPFQVNLRPAQADKVVVKDQHIPDEAGTGEPAWVDIDCSAAGSGAVTGNCRGEKVGNVRVEVKKTGRNEYRVNFKPPQADKYKFDVFYSGNPIPGSPFPMNLIPPQPDMVQLTNRVEPKSPGDSASLTFDTSKAGRGTLKAEACGDVVAFTPVSVTEQGSDCFTIAFKPEKPDCYKVHVSWGDRPVAGSPFTFDTRPKVYPEKVVCEQPVYTEAGKPVTVAVDATQAGPGTLTASCVGELAGKVPCEITATGESTYSVSCQPEREDIYTLSIFFHDEKVKGSPFSVDLQPKSHPDQCFIFGLAEIPASPQVDEPIRFGVDATKGGEGRLSARSDLEDSAVDVKPRKGNPQVYDISYIPSSIGQHQVHLKWGGQDIPGSPAKFTVGDDSASKVVATGPGVEGSFLGKETTFLVDGRIPKRRRLNISVVSPSGEPLTTKREPQTDTAVSYKYTPLSPGTYTVAVKLDEEHTLGSPFSVTHSMPPDASKCVASGDGLQKARVGETSEFSVDCKSGGPGDLEVEVEGPTCYVPEKKIELGEQEFKVEYSPLEPGPHRITVQWDGQHVPDSPFTCLVTDPRKCTATGAGLTKSKVGEPGRFTVKTDKAGPGTLTAEAEGPSGYTVPVQIRDEGKGRFSCTWIPKEEGQHTLNVKWSDAPITGSPFKLDAESTDPSKCRVSDLPLGKLRVGKISSFTVDTREAGSGELKASAHGPSVPEACEVVEKEADIYTVNFTPMEIGELKVEVSFGDDSIPESPFKFTVNDPTKCKVNAAAIAAGSYSVNQPVDFRVAARFAGEGELTATARGPKGEQQLEITNQDGGNHLIHYVPNDVGPQIIDIHFDGERIPKVPMRLFVEGGQLGSVVVTQPLPDRFGAFTIDHDYTYKVSAVGAGDEVLTATSYGARTGNTPSVDIKTVGDGLFNVILNAEAPDDYHVNIMWGDEHVPGSPFTLAVKDRSRAEKVVCSGPHFVVGKTDPVTLEIDTTKAGVGQLDVTCYGDTSGSVAVEVAEKGSKKYTVSFVPQEIDHYSFNVLWTGKAVKGSPFKANLLPPDASKCVVTGPALPSEANKPVEVTVDASDAGNGKLAATAVGDKAGPVDITVREKEVNVYDISFLPPVGDWYSLDVTWAEVSVPGAPWRLNLIPANAQAVRLVKSPEDIVECGQLLVYSFDTSNAGNGKLTATCSGGRATELPVVIAKGAPDQYDVKITPAKPDMYNLNVMWLGKHVKGSPFQINLTPIDISKVTVEGPTQRNGLQGPVETKLHTARAGRGKVTASCHNTRKETIPVAIEETTLDNYLLLFEPSKPEIYTFEVQYGGQDVSGSPFHINTLPPNASKVRVTEPEIVNLSEPVTFKVDASDAGAGELRAVCRGNKYGAVQPDISPESIGKFLVSFTPHHKDSYNLRLQWAGVEVPDSPFQVNLRPAQADKVVVRDQHIPDEAGTGEPAWVDIDCSAAGSGVVTGSCRGEKVGDVPVEVQRTHHNQYRVQFKPPQADKYRFDVLFSGNAIPGSTFRINLIPPLPEEVKLTRREEPQKPGDTASLDFNVSKAGRGSLTADVTGKEVGSTPITVTENALDNFRVAFKPTKPDCYEVNVYWAEKAVTDSPFTVDLRPKVQPDQVICEQPVYAESGKQVTIAVDASRAGPGTLTASYKGESGSKLPCGVKATGESTYSVSCEPDREGTYTVSIFYEKEEVRDSPFVVDLRPKKPVNESVTQRIIEQPEESINLDFLEARAQTPLESLPNEFTNYIGEPINLTVTMEEEQQGAQLIATAVGTKTGPAAIKVTKNADGTFDVHFNPEKPDRYTVDAQINGKSLPSVPLVVNYIQPIDPSKCHIFGLEGIPAAPQVDRPIVLGVDATQAGDSSLTVTVDHDGASSEEESMVTVTSRKDDPQIYDITFVPSVAGVHRINLLWNNQAIPGSPVQITAADSAASDLKVTGKGIQGDFVGKETSFLVSGRVPKRKKVNISVLSPSGEKVSTKKDRKTDVVTVYKYTPKSPGVYTVVVMLDKKHISGSPFSVTHSLPPDPSKCVARGDGLLLARVSETSEFSVNCESGGSGELQVEVQGPSGNVGTEITEPQDRDYKIEYAPLEPGPHTIAVKWDGQHVPDSPFTCMVTDPRKCTATGAGLTKAKVGEAGHFTVKTEKAGPGTLTAEAEGPSGDKIPVQIRDEGRGKYTCTWTPKEEGPHTINVKWSGAPITGSPFKVNAEPRADPSKCKVSDLPSGKLRAGKVSSFTVDTREAGSGELKASAHGPSVPEKCEVVAEDDGLYTVNFTPLEIGDLKVEVSYGDDSIPGSPFHFTVNDPTKCKVNAAAISAEPYRLKQPIDFRVSAELAGEGELVASLRGPKGRKQLNVTDEGKGSYLVHYVTSEVGAHVIDIQFDGEQIPKVPIRIFVESGVTVDSVFVTQPAPDRFGGFAIDRDYTYKVNAVEAGEGELVATSYGALTGQKPDLTVTDFGKGLFDVTLTADTPDDYYINILWGDVHVAGSPFKLVVKDKPRPEKVVCSGPQYVVGKTDLVSLDIDTEKAGVGKLDVTCHGSKVGPVQLKTVVREQDKYTVSFVPSRIDYYSFNVLWTGTAVKDSPFRANLVPPDASKCVVTGPDIPTEANKPVEVTVDAYEAGNGKLAATAVGETAGSVDVEIAEVEPNVYVASFIPPVGEWYDVDVTWAGSPVPGSPWRLNLAPPSAKGVMLLQPPPDTVEAGQPVNISFDVSRAGNGELTATCIGSDLGELPVLVMEQAPKEYIVKFTPTKADSYTIEVLWSGTHVRGSPFQLNLIPIDGDGDQDHGPYTIAFLTAPRRDSSATNQDIEPLGMMYGGKRLMLTVSGMDIDTTNISATLESVATHQTLPVILSQLLEGQIGLEFNPDQGSEYTLTLSCQASIATEDEIEGSPFILEFADPPKGSQ